MSTRKSLSEMNAMELTDAIGLPTLWLTENDERKWVRALGQLGVLPLLPWTILCAPAGLTVWIVGIWWNQV